MWQTLLSVFKSKKEPSTSALDSAWAEFDTLMVAVEEDEKDLEQLGRHVKQDFSEIEKGIEQEGIRVDNITK